MQPLKLYLTDKGPIVAGVWDAVLYARGSVLWKEPPVIEDLSKRMTSISVQRVGGSPRYGDFKQGDDIKITSAIPAAIHNSFLDIGVLHVNEVIDLPPAEYVNMVRQYELETQMYKRRVNKIEQKSRAIINTAKLASNKIIAGLEIPDFNAGIEDYTAQFAGK